MTTVSVSIEKFKIDFHRNVSDKLAMKIYRLLQPSKAEKQALEKEQPKPEPKA